MGKFKKNDVVVLNNPISSFHEEDAEKLHGEIGIIIKGNDSEWVEVKHNTIEGLPPESRNIPHFHSESELIKIGTL